MRILTPDSAADLVNAGIITVPLAVGCIPRLNSWAFVSKLCNDEKSTGNLNDLTGRKLHRYRFWRRNFNGGTKPVTEQTQMDTLRVFIRFLETIDSVWRDLSEKIQSPLLLGSREDVPNVVLGRGQAEAVVDL